MRKFLTVLVLVAMLLTTLGVVAAAESYMDKTPATCEVAFEVKKADPSVVKKDGIIDLEGGEYVELVVPVTELSINFRNSGAYTAADAMAQTMKYYFSWDETHGFNMAVEYKAKGDGYDGFNTNIGNGVGSDDPTKPQDNFMSNIGVNFASGTHKETEGWALLYYAVGKKFDGEYLKGHWNQLGNSGAYDPEGGKDFEVAYPNMDGTVIVEWSVPFSEFLDVTPAAGVSFGFALCAAAGQDTEAEFLTNCWSVSLGQNGGWLVSASEENGQAQATLSDEPVKAGAPVVTTPADTTVATTPAPTKPATTEVVTSVVTSAVAVTDDKGDVVTNESGDVVTDIVTEIVTSIVTDAPTANAGNGTNSPVTGDPMVIAAVVAAISACGVVVAKKRK